MKQFTLPKSERLYLRESIGELFANGRTFVVFPYRVVYLLKKADAENLPDAEKQGRCAIMAVAPKKRFKHAVDRNHVKRLTREAYRVQKLPLHETLEKTGHSLEVAFLYVDNKFITFDQTYKLMGKAIGKLQRVIQTEAKKNETS
ncbi:MAG: ribonuclease P protein component [Bacteroidales bacterium]|nr:ribonuclease P protein component [Bacteroidales bacterium]